MTTGHFASERGTTRLSLAMSGNEKVTLSSAQMAVMTPQARADAVDAATVRSWDEVSEPFRSEVLSTALALGVQRRKCA